MKPLTLIIVGSVVVVVALGGVAVYNTPQARTIRLNNPGAIWKSSVAWNGKVPTDDPNFEAFDSPLMGARAMLKNMKTHYDRGDKTIAKMIAGWTPDNRANYANAVSRAVFGDDTFVNSTFAWNFENATKIAKAMSDWETGVPWFQLGLFQEAWSLM